MVGYAGTVWSALQFLHVRDVELETPHRRILPAACRRSNASTVSASGTRLLQVQVEAFDAAAAQAAFAGRGHVGTGVVRIFLDTTNTDERRPVIARATISSAPPSPYISALPASAQVPARAARVTSRAARRPLTHRPRRGPRRHRRHGQRNGDAVCCQRLSGGESVCGDSPVECALVHFTLGMHLTAS